MADRVYYSGSLASAAPVVVPPQALSLRDQTRFRRFVCAEEPPQVVAFTTPIELVISPWDNL